jgi:FkbM family methyltransferase
MTLRDLLNKGLWYTKHKLVKISYSELTGLDWLIDSKVLIGDKRNVVLVDVGMNEGQTTEAMLQIFPDAKVFGFEPTPQLFAKLKERFARRENVVLFQKALGETKAKGTLHISRHPGATSLLPLDTTVSRGSLPAAPPIVSSCEVEVDSLDKVLTHQNPGVIDLLKIDVQGYELNVLKGTSQLLAEKRVRLILTEVMFVSEYRNQTSLAELLNYLLPLGYHIVGFYNRHYVGKVFTNCDVLWELSGSLAADVPVRV